MRDIAHEKRVGGGAGTRVINSYHLQSPCGCVINGTIQRERESRLPEAASISLYPDQSDRWLQMGRPERRRGERTG